MLTFMIIKVLPHPEDQRWISSFIQSYLPITDLQLAEDKTFVKFSKVG
jgi:hypothetical protein